MGGVMETAFATGATAPRGLGTGMGMQCQQMGHRSRNRRQGYNRPLLGSRAGGIDYACQKAYYTVGTV